MAPRENQLQLTVRCKVRRQNDEIVQNHATLGRKFQIGLAPSLEGVFYQDFFRNSLGDPQLINILPSPVGARAEARARKINWKSNNRISGL